MGTTLNWNSTYPATIDDNVTNFPTVNDNVHDVLASHVNELASAVIALENVVGGLRTTVIADPLSPSSGDVLIYNSVSGEWEAGAPSGISFSLQDAYDDGNTISLTAATPVAITTSGVGQDGITVTDGTDTVTLRGDQVLAPQGDAATPSYSFAGGVGFSNAGIHMSTANIIRFAIAGSNVFEIRSTFVGPSSGSIDLAFSGVPWDNAFINVLQAEAGAVGAPSVTTFTGSDTDTGFYWPSSDIVAATAGGTEVVRFSAPSGANPQALFADGTASRPAIAFGSEIDVGFYQNGNLNQISLATGGAERWRWQNDGSLRATSNGTAALPILSTVGGTTGIYFGVDNEFALTSGGNQVAGFKHTLNDDGEYTLQLISDVSQATTEGYRGLYLNVTETTTGDASATLGGINKVVDVQVGGSTVFAVAGNGGSTYSEAGGVLGPNGTASNPTFTYLNDPDTGMYLTTTGRIGLSFSGTNGYTFRNVEFYPNGTAGLGRVGDYWTSIWGSSAEGATTSGPSAASYDLTAVGTNAGAYAIGVDNSLLANVTDVNVTDLMTTLERLDGAISAAASSTLQDAYDGGNTITLAASTPVAITTSAVGQDGITVTDGVSTLSILGGGVILPAGSTSVPSLQFTGDINTGIYQATADQITFQTKGNTTMVVDGSGAGVNRVQFPSGNATNPSITFAGALTVGLYENFGQLGLSVGSTQRLLLKGGTTDSSANFSPSSASTYDLGSSSAQWRDIYVDRVLAGDGSFGNPSISFESSPDTGFRNSSDTIVVSNAGSDTWGFNTTSGDLISYLGVILNTDGTATDPAYSFSSDTDTGIYRVTTNRLGAAAGGDPIVEFARNSGNPQLRLSADGSVTNPSFTLLSDTDTGIFRPIDGWEGTGWGVSVSGGEVARFENDNAWDDGNLQITKDFISPTAVEQVYQYDASGTPYDDVTTAATNATTGDWNVFPASEVAGDAAVFGMDLPFNALVFDNTGGTAGTSGAVIWEYWNGSAWASLSVLEDGTSGFTAAVGSGQVLRFVEPTDWATTSLGSVTKYYIRARITNTYVVNPVYDQVVAVSQQTGAVVRIPDASVITSGEYARMDAYKVQAYGIPTGDVTIRYFVAEFLNNTNVSIQSLGGGGVGMFLPQANAPAYCFLDGTNDIDEGIGYGADTGQQRLLMYVDNKTEGFRVEAAQVFANDGSAAAPGYSFINEDDVGIYREGTNKLGLAAQGEAVIVDNDSATPSFRPDADDTWTLGEAALRWADLFSVTTTVGDLIMHDPDEGKDSPFLILREAHETIEVFDVQANKKFVIPLQEVQMTPEDQERINKARAKFYGDK